MYILKNDNNCTFIIKKSKFICYLFNINDENDCNYILNNLRNEYKDATHICYAYNFLNKQKYSDDKEPSGTAGIPMLDVLKKNNLVNTLAVIVRYFGGIKLGASNLTRTYRNCLNDTIKSSSLIIYKEYILKKITFKYEDENTIIKFLDNSIILDKIYNEYISYIVKLDKNDFNKIINLNIKIEDI